MTEISKKDVIPAKEFESKGTTFISKVLKRGGDSYCIALLKDYRKHLKLQVGQVVMVAIFRRKDET